MFNLTHPRSKYPCLHCRELSGYNLMLCTATDKRKEKCLQRNITNNTKDLKAQVEKALKIKLDNTILHLEFMGGSKFKCGGKLVENIKEFIEEAIEKRKLQLF